MTGLTLQQFSHYKLEVSEDIIKEANDFLANLKDKDIENPIFWMNIYTKNPVLFDLLVIFLVSARMRIQPASCLQGNKKGLPINHFIRDLKPEDKFFTSSFLQVLSAIWLLIRNQPIRMDVKLMSLNRGWVKAYDVLALVGASGVGKSSFSKELPQSFTLVKMITTRQSRGESDNETKTFVTNEAFEEMVEDKMLAAWEEHSGNKYGVAKATLEDNKNAGQVSLVDFKGEGFTQLMLDAGYGIRAISFSYKDGGQAETNLRARMAGGSKETEDDLKTRMGMVKKDMEFVEKNASAFSSSIIFEWTKEPKKFWKTKVKDVV